MFKHSANKKRVTPAPPPPPPQPKRVDRDIAKRVERLERKVKELEGK